ncbi:hypothetical protein BSKO_05771 [Bryopsis sp. KO-2023]|nr:hypothetical protein BSKO_05771 [Bryopsis sp. KO-2023]
MDKKMIVEVSELVPRPCFLFNPHLMATPESRIVFKSSSELVRIVSAKSSHSMKKSLAFPLADRDRQKQQTETDRNIHLQYSGNFRHTFHNKIAFNFCRKTHCPNGFFQLQYLVIMLGQQITNFFAVDFQTRGHTKNSFLLPSDVCNFPVQV